jgi:hypothetical protein
MGTFGDDTGVSAEVVHAQERRVVVARLEVEDSGCVFIGKNKSRPVLGGLFDTLESDLIVS